MVDIVKTNNLILLYDFYSKLLTNKQQEYFELYFFENHSLSEIANNKDVSRNAVSDSLNKVIKILYDYEEKLLLYKKHQERLKIYEQNFDTQQLIKLLKKIDE